MESMVYKEPVVATLRLIKTSKNSKRIHIPHPGTEIEGKWWAFLLTAGRPPCGEENQMRGSRIGSLSLLEGTPSARESTPSDGIRRAVLVGFCPLRVGCIGIQPRFAGRGRTMANRKGDEFLNYAKRQYGIALYQSVISHHSTACLPGMMKVRYGLREDWTVEESLYLGA